jgi:hypothetical protein
VTVRRVTGWIMRRPEHLTDTDSATSDSTDNKNSVPCPPAYGVTEQPYSPP